MYSDVIGAEHHLGMKFSLSLSHSLSLSLSYMHGGEGQSSTPSELLAPKNLPQLSRFPRQAWRPSVVARTGRSLADVVRQAGNHLFSPGPHAPETLEHLHV